MVNPPLTWFCVLDRFTRSTTESTIGQRAKKEFSWISYRISGKVPSARPFRFTSTPTADSEGQSGMSTPIDFARPNSEQREISRPAHRSTRKRISVFLRILFSSE
jgi:hypothetical protein